MDYITQYDISGVCSISWIIWIRVALRNWNCSVAHIHVSIMVIGDGTPESILALIRENTADLRRRLGLREGKQLRIIPHLEFYLDDSLDYIENIERLLKQ